MTREELQKVIDKGGFVICLDDMDIVKPTECDGDTCFFTTRWPKEGGYQPYPNFCFDREATEEEILKYVK